eukprot:gb/GEZN01017224.1/.p1 GENE.gb/GEZN01017224.1/~~gb/GEZN01017224.1/.p1  ORF type:complete len:257 (+),score=53.98 gb/GEZN01017224.1/:96-773(+)
MTTAHKPTYHPAVGSAFQGGYRYHAPRKQFSARDIASHTKLKFRQIGQGAPQELALRDMDEELKEREREHSAKTLQEQRRAGLLPYAQAAPDPTKQMAQIDMAQYDDSDDEDDDDSENESDDGEDEEAELLKELEKIKKEREEEKRRKEEEEQAALEAQNQEAVLRGNPLMAEELTGDSFSVKRRWDDDVAFKNQARDVVKAKKRFINDTIRSDFHRMFLGKYIK